MRAPLLLSYCDDVVVVAGHPSGTYSYPWVAIRMRELHVKAAETGPCDAWSAYEAASESRCNSVCRHPMMHLSLMQPPEACYESVAFPSPRLERNT